MAQLNDSKGGPDQKKGRVIIFIAAASCCPALRHTLLLSAISSQKIFSCLARERADEERGIAGDRAAGGTDWRAWKPYLWPI